MTLPHIEQIREAYTTNNFDRIQSEVDALRQWIAADDATYYHITEPQLSALLFMTQGYVSRCKYQ